MIYVFSYTLLIFKYLVISRLLDPGYSTSRNGNNVNWKVATVSHVLMQTAFTVLFFHHHTATLPLVILIEVVFMLSGTWIERRATGFAVIKAYLLSEVLMVLGYALAVTWMQHPL